MDCIFCRIISGEVPGEIVYQDDEAIAFRDINPQAPTHILIMPKSHIPSIAEVEDYGLVGRLVNIAKELAKREGVGERGYRLVINSGPDSGQEVPHLHLHLLGGRVLGRLG
jgi:histidine triad (HIT) family protein